MRHPDQIGKFNTHVSLADVSFDETKYSKNNVTREELLELARQADEMLIITNNYYRDNSGNNRILVFIDYDAGRDYSANIIAYESMNKHIKYSSHHRRYEGDTNELLERLRRYADMKTAYGLPGGLKEVMVSIFLEGNRYQHVQLVTAK